MTHVLSKFPEYVFLAKVLGIESYTIPGTFGSIVFQLFACSIRTRTNESFSVTTLPVATPGAQLRQVMLPLTHAHKFGPAKDKFLKNPRDL